MGVSERNTMLRQWLRLISQAKRWCLNRIYVQLGDNHEGVVGSTPSPKTHTRILSTCLRSGLCESYIPTPWLILFLLGINGFKILIKIYSRRFSSFPYLQRLVTLILPALQNRSLNLNRTLGLKSQLPDFSLEPTRADLWTSGSS